MHVIHGICPNVVVPIYAVWKQLEWWYGQQSPLIDLRPLWSSSRKVSRWTCKYTSKYWQKKCYHESLKILETVTPSLKTILSPTHRGVTVQKSFQQVSGQVQISTQWTLLSGPSLIVMSRLNPNQVWLLWKCPPCSMVCFGLWSSKTFMSLINQSFGAYGQGKRSFWNLTAVLY